MSNYERMYLGRKIRISMRGNSWNVGMTGVVNAVVDGLLYGSWGRFGINLNTADIEIVA